MSQIANTLLLHLLAAKIRQPETEYRFHPTRMWRFDLCWPDQMLAVEVQGGVWSRGRHTRGQGYTNDCEKLNEAQILGWRVLYVTADQVNNGQALDWIQKALDITKDA